MELNEDRIKNEIEDLVFKLNPFGYLDLKFCIKAALKVGEDADWVADQLESYCDMVSCGLKDIDPCYVIYDVILQEARYEIDNLTRFDIQRNASFDIYVNFLDTRFTYDSGESVEDLTEKLAENNIQIEDLSLKTQYFLNEIGITQEDIDAKIEELNNDESEENE